MKSRSNIHDNLFQLNEVGYSIRIYCYKKSSISHLRNRA